MVSINRVQEVVYNKFGYAINQVDPMSPGDEELAREMIATMATKVTLRRILGRAPYTHFAHVEYTREGRIPHEPEFEDFLVEVTDDEHPDAEHIWSEVVIEDNPIFDFRQLFRSIG